MKIFTLVILVSCLQNALSLSINSSKVESKEDTFEATVITTTQKPLTTESNIEEIKRQEHQRALARNRVLNGKFSEIIIVRKYFISFFL